MENPKEISLITIIHGTWATTSSWAAEDSRFLNIIAGAVEGETFASSFKWSGFNRDKSRRDAAKKLKSQIVNMNGQYRAEGYNVRHYLIGHSHGGNVASYAFESLLKDDKASREIAGVVCMATPFVHFFYNSSIRMMNAFALFFLLLIVMGVLAILYPIAKPLLAILTFLSAGTFLAFKPLFKPKNKEWNKISKKVTQANLLGLDADRFLILRNFGDEASGLLSAVGLFNWLGSTIFTKTTILVKNKLTSWLLTLSGILFFAYWLVPEIKFIHYVDIGEHLLLFSFYVLAGISCLAFLLFLIRSLLTLCVGSDIPFQYFGMGVAADAAPSNGSYTVATVRTEADFLLSTISNFDLDPDYDPNAEDSFVEKPMWEGLKHSEVYEGFDTFLTIVRWINGLNGHTTDTMKITVKLGLAKIEHHRRILDDF